MDDREYPSATRAAVAAQSPLPLTFHFGRAARHLLAYQILHASSCASVPSSGQLRATPTIDLLPAITGNELGARCRCQEQDKRQGSHGDARSNPGSWAVNCLRHMDGDRGSGLV